MFCGLWGFNCSEISLPIATKGTWGHGQVEVEGANLHKGEEEEKEKEET